MTAPPSDFDSLDPQAPRVGLVLSGGGARGAYEIGVLRYLRERIKIPTRFHAITGSSVGAVNGAYLAATCDRPRAQMRLLSRVWTDMRLDEMYRFGWLQMRALPRVLFGRNLPEISHGITLGGLVDSSYIESIVRDMIPWPGIRANLQKGHLNAFACSATEVLTGTTTVFVNTRTGNLPPWPLAPGQTIVPTTIGAAHTLASAAIPVLFPPVRVGGKLFVDGSLRQNTPVRPAMYLGANRLLVVGLRHAETEDDPPHPEVVYPNAVFMLGKMLNALMLDKLEADLARIERMNQWIEAGTEAYGESFSKNIATRLHGRQGRVYQKIDIVLIQPSRDLGEIAADVIRRTRLSKYKGLAASWLRRMIEQTDDVAQSDLASYVLFDRDYVSQLIELGWNDARAKHAELLALFE